MGLGFLRGLIVIEVSVLVFSEIGVWLVMNKYLGDFMDIILWRNVILGMIVVVSVGFVGCLDGWLFVVLEVNGFMIL